MNIERQLAHCTCRILATRGDGSQHFGTGFFLSYEVSTNKHKIFCVTNRHVLDGAVKCVVPFTLANDHGEPMYGKIAELEIDPIDATFHPRRDIDLAAFLISPGINTIARTVRPPYFITIERSAVPDENVFSDLDVATEILMIGYPSGLSDAHNNLPIIRRGSAATPPSLDFNGAKQFVIDCASYPGSSGSPVFSFQTNFKQGNSTVMSNIPRAILIGILFAGPQISISGRILPEIIPTTLTTTVQSFMPMHLGFCIKSTELAWLDSMV